MKAYLLDVNALLALLDPLHVHHEAIHLWYSEKRPIQFLTCAHTVNGTIRVASQPKYPNCFGTSAQVRDALRSFIVRTDALACAEEASLLNDEVLVRADLLRPQQVADLYLLALAVANEAILATFDQGIAAHAIQGGEAALEVIPNP